MLKEKRSKKKITENWIEKKRNLEKMVMRKTEDRKEEKVMEKEDWKEVQNNK